MVKHIWKMIWNQRSSNGWIFMELLLVFGALLGYDGFDVGQLVYLPAAVGVRHRERL